ncbi:hypothetical protein J4732_13995 [Serratia marcescens]|uniref:Uncharacterized protein n=1 Tax=Serratia marcescens TaxID=615 RepID=A0A939SVC2_SERMA|nr:hypothetical protein [Serratia marcescens]
MLTCWLKHRWIADLKPYTQHRVLLQATGLEPITRLIAVVSDLHRNHAATSQEA